MIMMRMRIRMMMNDKRKREKIAIFDIICRIVEGGRRGQTARAIYLEGWGLQVLILVFSYIFFLFF